MNNFDHHVAQLEALGFTLERGMLVGDGRFPNANQIGTRFLGQRVQIDTYLHSAFFDADKAHPVLGESQEITGPDGSYRVQEILAQ
ncbi:MAG: hypothetical protein ACKOWK_01445 [Micrococcales bacterium]